MPAEDDLRPPCRGAGNWFDVSVTREQVRRMNKMIDLAELEPLIEAFDKAQAESCDNGVSYLLIRVTGEPLA